MLNRDIQYEAIKTPLESQAIEIFVFLRFRNTNKTT